MLIFVGQVMVFLVGAIVGSALDQLHVLGGVLTNPPRTLAQQLIWTPSVFGIGALAMVWPFRLLFRRGAPRWRRRVPSVLLLLDFAAAYALTAGQKDHPVMVTLVLLATWLLAASVSRTTLLYGLGVGIAGPLFEAALSAMGVFSYLAPGLIPYLHVPMWLPALYLHASLCARGLEMALFPATGHPHLRLLSTPSIPPLPGRREPQRPTVA